MYWRAWTQMSSALPFGGGGLVSDALRFSPAASEWGALMMLGSLMNVTTVRISRITAAPDVHPISSLVLPWVWVATGCFLARKRNTATTSAPSTATNTIAATINTIT